MMTQFRDELYKGYGVLWRVIIGDFGDDYIGSPVCSNESCHCELRKISYMELYCDNCERKYSLPKTYDECRDIMDRRHEGRKTLDWAIYSLELPPTKVSSEDREDENYWVQAKISEKQGKRMAVVYFGEKLKKQSTKDYLQMFVDFDEEQIRFDKNNKNPMKLLSKITAEFPSTKIEISNKDTV